MKRKLFNALLFGALVASSTSTFVSCKDYDDDIQSLQAQIDANKKSIESIEALIKSGSVITNVEQSTNGVKVTLSDGKTFNLTNGADGKDGQDGKDGAPGTAWTIGSDGYWYKDGSKTDYYALGTKGDKGDKGDQGDKGDKGDAGEDGAAAQGKYYVINAETFMLDLYEDGVLVKAGAVDLNAGSKLVTAALDGNNLVLMNVDGSTSPIVISNSSDLQGLVFMPSLYLDGIETIAYPWLTGVTYKESAQYSANHRDNIIGSTAKKKVQRLTDWSPIVPNVVYNYGPAWPVLYNMNPSNAKTEWSSEVDYLVLNSDVVYTRAFPVLDVNSPEKDAAGNKLFFSANGILSAGLQVTNPQNLVEHPTTNAGNHQDNVIALQVPSKNNLGEKCTITSDYALIQPEKAELEAIVWNVAPDYVKNPGRLGDGPCSASVNPIHVYDTPEAALQTPDGAALEMQWDGNGIDIASHLGICYKKYDVKSDADVWSIMPYGTEGPWGLKYEFSLVEYLIDGNVTIDSRYATWANQAEGKLKACTVDADGNSITSQQSETAVDREPLVRVLVKNINGSVVLDGYILVHIARTTPATPSPVNLNVDNYPVESAEFDLCNAEDVYKQTTWGQFSNLVLQTKLENMTKEDFDAQYEADKVSPTPVDFDGNGNPVYALNIYTAFAANGADGDAARPEVNPLGTVFYYGNSLGTTNHTFKWTISEAQLEEVTHHATSLPVNKERYVRFKAIPGSNAKYPYIYLKLSTNIGRATIPTVAYGEKNNNYWYGLDGSDNGLEAIVFDAKAPYDGGNINTINRSIRTTLLGNIEARPVKYYFVPGVVEVFDAKENKTWYITPKSGSGDVVYDDLIDRYITTLPVHNYGTQADLNTLLNECAVDYESSAFNNVKLYATDNLNNTNYTQIATLTSSTGDISLIKNAVAKSVLNAVGYEANHANINKELRTLVSVVANNGCRVATRVSEAPFTVSWQRPINMKEFENKVTYDAATNWTRIYALDYIKLFDWRGETVGYMWDDQTWFWAYYNVNSITIDTNPDHVLTNMHNGSTFKKLSEISTAVELYWEDGGTTGKNAHPFNFNLTSYNNASSNSALISYMNANKALFGTILYKDNGDNVTDFDLIIPVTIGYEWGEFKTSLTLRIERTAGH